MIDLKSFGCTRMVVMKMTTKVPTDKIKEENTFVCISCGNILFHTIDEVREHLAIAHNITNKGKCRKSALMYTDYGEYSKEKWEWTFVREDRKFSAIMVQNICKRKVI